MNTCIEVSEFGIRKFRYHMLLCRRRRLQAAMEHMHNAHSTACYAFGVCVTQPMATAKTASYLLSYTHLPIERRIGFVLITFCKRRMSVSILNVTVNVCIGWVHVISVRVETFNSVDAFINLFRDTRFIEFNERIWCGKECEWFADMFCWFTLFKKIKNEKKQTKLK